MDWWNPAIAVAGLLVGLVVGLTGMGGGALMTPTLVFFFGDFALGLTGSILVGAIPGVWVGARVSSRSPGSLVRRTLAVLLLASGQTSRCLHQPGAAHHRYGAGRRPPTAPGPD
jgi:uncharacterized membrane protein YfcA